jgi:thioredoxin 1
MTTIIRKIRKSAIFALVFLCLMTLALTGDCQPSLEMQAEGNGSLQAQSFPNAPLVLNDDTLDDAIRIYPHLVLDCWEIGCPPCELIDPKIGRMAEDFRGRIAFAKLCIDRNPISMGRYRISRTPTLLVFNNGTLVAKQVGNYPQDTLERMILAVLHMQ